MNHLSLILAVLGGICGAVAVAYAYKSSSIEPKAAWDYNPELRPRNFQQHAFGMVNALEAAAYWAGRANRTAALWGTGAVIFGVLAAVTAWMQ